MKQFLLITFLLTNIVFAQEEKIFISTFSQKIEIIDEVQSSNPHTLYAITNSKQKNVLLTSIYNFTKKDSSGVNLVFNFFAMQLNNTDYDTNICYVLVSTLTNDLEINQPYHYKDSSDLIFEIEKKESQKNHYVYIRTYKVKIAEDTFDKYILENDNKIKMEAVKL